MITKDEAETLRDLVGYNYTGKLDEYFRRHNIVSRDNEPYTKQMLGKVFNGDLASEKIEKHIWDFIDEFIQLNKQAEEKKKTLLKTAKNLTHG